MLEVQLLQDIPDGSIPLKSHEQTQISNVQVQPYSTKTFEREFYFPSEGRYQVYPANASKNRARRQVCFQSRGSQAEFNSACHEGGG